MKRRGREKEGRGRGEGRMKGKVERGGRKGGGEEEERRSMNQGFLKVVRGGGGSLLMAGKGTGATGRGKGQREGKEVEEGRGGERGQIEEEKGCWRRI